MRELPPLSSARRRSQKASLLAQVLASLLTPDEVDEVVLWLSWSLAMFSHARPKRIMVEAETEAIRSSP